MPSATPKIQGYSCAICKDMGFYLLDVPLGHPDFGKARTCNCRSQGLMERQYKRLQAIDGLTPTERRMRFAGLIVEPENTGAFESVQYALSRKRGIVTLYGKPGRGKSTLMIAAVNEAREANIPAVYAKVSDVLDYLRNAYDPRSDRELTVDDRWHLLTTVDVLALDELDQFKTTEWAMEKFLGLMDERWRNIDRAVTLIASNAAVANLPEKVASRLQDRRAQLFHLTGPDMRKFNTWSTDQAA